MTGIDIDLSGYMPTPDYIITSMQMKCLLRYAENISHSAKCLRYNNVDLIALTLINADISGITDILSELDRLDLN